MKQQYSFCSVLLPLFLPVIVLADTHRIRTTLADSSNVSFIACTPLSWGSVSHDGHEFIRFTDTPVTDSIGYPELPMITCLVAVPDSVTPSIEYSYGLEFEQPIMPVFPAPAIYLDTTNCTRAPADSFLQDSTAYASESFWPSERVRLIGEMRICDQRLLKIQLFPAQYRAADSTLSTVSSFSISVSYDSSEAVWNSIGMGEFQRFANGSPVVGYHHRELSSSPVPDYFGVVDPYYGPAYPNDRMPEYIIVCASGLHTACRVAITELAEHRVSLNQFDVATVLTDDILADFGSGQSCLTDEMMRDFTEHMWENWPGASLDHPRYLLLIGDHEDTSCASADWFLPTHVFDAAGLGTDIGNDEWYAYFNGNRGVQNDYPSMIVGRLSVRNGGTVQTDTLTAMIENIIALEQPIQSVPLVDNRRRILRFAGTGQNDSGDTGLQVYQSWKPNRGWTAGFADWLNYGYTTYYGGDCRDFTMSDSSLMSSADFLDAYVDEFHSGAGVAFYTDHGEVHFFSAGLDWSTVYYPFEDDYTKGVLDSTFNNIQIENQLQSTGQYYSAPLVLMLCCSAGTFNHTNRIHANRVEDPYFCLYDRQGYDYDFGTDCIAEKLLKNTRVPVAGVFAASQLSETSVYSCYGTGILEAIYARGHGRIGDAVASARLEYIGDFLSGNGCFNPSISQFNLLGDPALDISDRVRYPDMCDLEIYSDDICISQYPLETSTGIDLPITITVQNNGNQESDEYDIRVTVTHGAYINTSYITGCDGLPAGRAESFEHHYAPAGLNMPLNVNVEVEVDCNDACQDSWRGNNEAQAAAQLVDTYPTESGWPIEVLGAVETTPVLTNLDSDPDLEIVCLAGTSLIAFDTGGTEMWRLMSQGFSNSVQPLAADLDADGHPEILLFCFDQDIKVVDYQGNVIDSLESASGAFAVGELTSNNGLELCVGFGNTIGLFGLSNGSLTNLAVKDFGYIEEGEPEYLVCGELGGSHTFQDVAYLNGTHPSDPSPDPRSSIEIYNWATSSLVYSKTWSEYVYGVTLCAGSLGGIESVGYPAQFYNHSTDVPAQIIEPGEGAEEVACNDDYMLPTSSLTHGVIVDWDPLVAGTDTYVVHSERQCMAWNADGDRSPNFPTVEFSGASRGSPKSPAALGDINGMDSADILFSTRTSGSCSIIAYDSEGNPLSSSGVWPFILPDGVDAYGGFAIADIDRDGAVEVLFGSSDGLLHCWEFESCSTGYTPWPMYQHDCGRSGALE